MKYGWWVLKFLSIPHFMLSLTTGNRTLPQFTFVLNPNLSPVTNQNRLFYDLWSRVMNKDTWLHTFFILECQAAYELFTKDVSDQMLGINELDLVLRSLGHVSTCVVAYVVYILLHVLCTHNCTGWSWLWVTWL